MVALAVDAGGVLVNAVADQAPDSIRDIEARAGVAEDAAIAQHAAAPVHAGRVPPARQIVGRAVERAAGRVEARAVVMRRLVVILSGTPQLKPGGVVVRHVVVRPCGQPRRGVIEVETGAVVERNIARGLEARTEQRQAAGRVIEEHIIADDGVRSCVLQIDAVGAAAVDVIRTVAQHHGIKAAGEDAVILIMRRTQIEVAIEDVVRDERRGGGRVRDVQARAGVFEHAGILQREVR